MFSNVVSPFCGCVCDDVTLEVTDDGRIVPVGPICESAANAYATFNSAPDTPAWHQGTPCSLEDGLSEASRLLASSRSPLLFGMQGMGTNSQRAAIQLAESLGAVIDPASSRLAQASLQAFQTVGLSTCTLGEVKQRADLIVIWGADPATTHSRLLQRLNISTENRTIIVIDHQPTATSRSATSFLKIQSGGDLDLILALRQRVQDDQASPESACGLSQEQIRQLAQQLKTCRYGTIFFGERLAQGNTPELTLEMLFRLVAQLSSHTRFTARALGRSGAENVLAWQTGFGSAVDFARGFPRAVIGGSGAEQLLLRGEVDCCFILGSRSLSVLTDEAIEVLQTLPTILVDPCGFSAPFTPTVHISTAVDGIHTRDTIYRFDDVPLPLRPLLKTDFPTVSAVLNQLSKMQGDAPP